MLFRLLNTIFLNNRLVALIFLLSVEILPSIFMNLVSSLLLVILWLQIFAWSGRAFMVLRKGVAYSAPILLVQLGVIVYLSWNSKMEFQLYVIISTILWLLTLAPAAILRTIKQWSWALLSISTILILSILFFYLVSDNPNAVVAEQIKSLPNIDDLVRELQGQGIQSPEKFLVGWTMKMFFSVLFFVGFLVTVLARFWQSSMFVPGGFSEEFIRIRFPLALSAPLAIVFISIDSYDVIGVLGWIAVLPLIFSALSVVHFLMIYKKIPSPLVALGYAFLFVVFSSFAYLAVFISLADSLWNLRDKILHHKDED